RRMIENLSLGEIELDLDPNETVTISTFSKTRTRVKADIYRCLDLDQVPIRTPASQKPKTLQRDEMKV
ncbi:78_t:CDS:2, partial [Racocetra persica]